MIQVELLFSKNAPFRSHFLQPLSGFFALRHQRIIDLSINYNADIVIPFSNTFAAKINNKYNILFDVEDGTDNFELSEQLDYFEKNKILLFKRAYDKSLYAKYSFVRPFGLNYQGLVYGFLPHIYIYLITNYNFFKNLILANDNCPFFSNIEKYWCMNVKTKSLKDSNTILFCTRLWDSSSPGIAEINDFRISTAKQIRRYFNNRAIAGVSDSSLARKMCPNLILPNTITKRNNYIKLMNEASICVATTGVHKSTGWRVAEYVAAGKAFVTEPLSFSLPGDFEEGKNYLIFNTLDQLVSAIDNLLSNPKHVWEMQLNNLYYFQHYLRPDIQVFNALKTIF